MVFIPLYFKDRLKVVNPRGTIGVVTLWSKIEYVMERFRQAEVDLNPATSPIAVFGNLYGNGLREMLRNLLHNPQIQTLVIAGWDRSGALDELKNFFNPALGLEPVDTPFVQYKSLDADKKVSPVRIRGTRRIIDDLVRPGTFTHPPEIVWLTDFAIKGTIEAHLQPPTADITGFVGTDAEGGEIEGSPETETFPHPPHNNHKQPQWEAEVRIKNFFDSYEPRYFPEATRLEVPLPEVEVQYFPGNPRGHVVVRETILEAWKEVLYLLTRFGRRVTLKKGDRLELQHVKVVVEKPRFEPEGQLLAAHLDPERLRGYQADLLKGELRPDETYNYGHRLRSYFGQDNLEACARRLQADPEDRKSYITLWDNGRDLTAAEGRPCLVSLYFRKFEGKLTLGATFRTHNAMDAYPLNLYGLMAIQEWVAARAGMKPGALVVVSHSLGLDPRELDRALMIIGKRPFKVRLDPMGYFRITLDGKDILVEHRFEDVTLKEYRGRKAERLQHEIARDVALSDINHAIYLGRQLARAEAALKEGREFVQD
jgi:thymidylate synthase